MEEASVGVNQPPTKPHRMMTGVMRAGMEPRNWRINALKWKGWRSYLRTMAKPRIMIISSRPMSTPGTTPPINNLSTLTLATLP